MYVVDLLQSTEDGASLGPGAGAVLSVEAASKSVNEPVPIPLRRSVARGALEETRRGESATLSLVNRKMVGKGITLYLIQN